MGMADGLELDDLLGLHQSRSNPSRKTDEALKAEIAPNMETWAMEPAEYDWPGVDTPTAATDRDIMEFNEGNMGLNELGERIEDRS